MTGDIVGTAKIKLEFDDKSVDTSTKAADSKLSAWTVAAGNMISSAVTTIVSKATSSLTSLVKGSIDLYGEYEQLTGGIETLFKNSYDSVIANADRAYITAGLSANKYMEITTSFSASLLQGLGGDTVAAAQIADQAIVDMSDNANKMGTSIGAIQDAYQGFAKQNYTMLDNLKLGYGGTAAEMARLINDSGVLGDSFVATAQNVNTVSFDKMIEAIHVVQTDLGITGTTALEASTTLQGSASSMQAAWQNLMTGMSNEAAPIGPLVEDLVNSIGTYMENLLPILGAALEGIIKVIGELAPKIIEYLPKLISDILPSIIEAITGVFLALVDILPTLVQSLIDTIVGCLPAMLDGAIELFMALVEALPTIIDTLVAALPGLLDAVVQKLTSPDFLTRLLDAAIELLMALVRAVPDVMVALINALPTILSNVILWLTSPETIGKLICAAIELFFGLVKAVPQILGALIGAFGTLVGNLWNGITGMFGDFAGKFGNFIGNIFKSAINGVISFIEGFINLPIDVINGFIGIINGAFGWIGVNIGYIPRVNLPRLAQGGVVDESTAAIIGESGREAVIPLENNTDNWSGLLAETLLDSMEERDNYPTEKSKQEISITNNITVTNDYDARKLSDMITRQIRRTA